MTLVSRIYLTPILFIIDYAVVSTLADFCVGTLVHYIPLNSENMYVLCDNRLYI